MAYSLSRQNTEALGRVLANLMIQSEADGCLVCDQAGHVLAQAGMAADDPHLLSALGAGVFAATGELARLLGEDEFSMVMHQGKRRSILLCGANDDALLAVIFSADVNLGLVKLYTPPSAAAVRAVLEDACGQAKWVDNPEHIFVLSEDADIFGVAPGTKG